MSWPQNIPFPPLLSLMLPFRLWSLCWMEHWMEISLVKITLEVFWRVGLWRWLLDQGIL
jgi:hypothetical protein